MRIATTQKGVALITALMIVAMASIVSVNISTKLQVDVRRTGNIIARDQAKLFSTAAEELAQRYLNEDDSSIDHLEEEWAQEYIFPLEGGTLQARLTDLQSCINLNSLSDSNPNKEIALKRMQQLFINAELSANLTQGIIDWIDSDLETTIPDGAEDGYYTALEKPYRSANTYIQSPSELKLVKGFENQETFDSLQDYFCAFGSAGATASININTAPSQVLLSLSSNMDESTAEDIIKNRVESPFKDINEFKSFANLATIITQTENLSVNTNYFMLETNIVIGKARVKTYSIIHREPQSSGSGNGKITVLARSQGAY